MRVRELAEWLGAPFEGDGEREIAGVATLEDAGPAHISFVGNRRAAKLAESSQAGCLLAGAGFESPRTIIRVENPRAAFARVVARLHPQRPDGLAIHPSAAIGEGARLGQEVRVGPGCSIGRDVEVGDGTVIHANVTLYDRVRVGRNCILHAGAVIGADGFGFVLEDGRYFKFPQVGTVEIGDDVEIGANSCIDRAALGVTSIGEGTKLDNMVHVAHNCRIGRHVVVAAQTGFSGGVIVEDYAVIGGQVGIGDKARIESRAVLGSGCGVLTSKVIRAGQVVWGTPARPLKEHLEQLANLGRLGELRREVAALRRAVEEIQRQLEQSL